MPNSLVEYRGYLVHLLVEKTNINPTRKTLPIGFNCQSKIQVFLLMNRIKFYNSEQGKKDILTVLFPVMCRIPNTPNRTWNPTSHTKLGLRNSLSETKSYAMEIVSSREGIFCKKFKYPICEHALIHSFFLTAPRFGNGE